MSTGVQVSQEAIGEFNDFKLRAKYRYIIFQIADNQVKIESTGAPGSCS
jgi:hypothetical protein